MEHEKIIRKLDSCESLRATILKNKRKKIARKILIAALIYTLFIILLLIFKFKLLGWVLMLILATILSVLLCKPYQFFYNDIMVGIIESIRHDYSLQTKKGTKGFSQSHIYTSIKEHHDIVMTLLPLNGKQRKQEIICPPQYERIFRVGDTVLYHPHLHYPANLSNVTKCVCMNCGTMQSANNIECFNCKVGLLNFEAMHNLEE